MEKTRTIQLGIIGCGRVTEHYHVPALRRVRGLEVVALADADFGRAQDLARRSKVARCYSNYSELIETAEIDAIAVCAPPQLHAEIALAALQYGKHLFIEKPLALSLPECDQLIERANSRNHLKVMVGFNLRWHRLVREARRILDKGDLGDIKLVRTVFTNGARHREDFAPWRRERRTGGGAILDLGAHHFDLLRFLLRTEPREIYSPAPSSDETGIVMISMINGTEAICAFSEGTGENHAIEVYGARGWLRLDCYQADGLERFGLRQYPGTISSRLRRLRQTLGDLPRIIAQLGQGGDYAASYAEQWRHFAESINYGSPVECGLMDGRRSLEIALAASEASSTGRGCRLKNPAS